MERTIGEVFKDRKTTIQCIKSRKHTKDCRFCHYDSKKGCRNRIDKNGSCHWLYRNDNKVVYFARVI